MKYIFTYDEGKQLRGWTSPQQCIGEDIIFLNSYGNYEQKTVENITTVNGDDYVVFAGKQMVRTFPLSEVHFMQACPQANGKKYLITKWSKKDIEDANRLEETIRMYEGNYDGFRFTVRPNYHEDLTSLNNIVCEYYDCKKVKVKLESREIEGNPYYGDTVPIDVYDSEYRIKSVEDINDFLEWCCR